MSLVRMVTASGEEHGLIDTWGNSVPFDDFKHMDPKTKAECEKQKKEDQRIVKCRYINRRGMHERLDKTYCRWSGDSLQKWHLIPGKEYDVPYGMVKEVNASKMIKRSGLVSQDGADLNGGAPLAKDDVGESLHELVPAKFF